MASIALYERDDLMYGLLREWLSAAGHVLRDSTGVQGAIAGADLVIVSFSMLKGETQLFVRGMQRIHPGAPIIALSSQARLGLSSDGVLARELGVERVMAKPLTRKELIAAIDDILAVRKRVPRCP
jgi:DNA-binding response OmpR family regulator